MSACKASHLFSCADALHDRFILPSTLKPPPPPPFHLSPPLSPLFPPLLHVTFCSFSHSSDCSLTPSSSFPVTVSVVWIPSLVVRGLQADTTPPYMNGMYMTTGNSFWFMQYHAVGNKYPNQNVPSGAQQEAVQHA